MPGGLTLNIYDDEAPVLFLPLNSTDTVPQLFLPPNSPELKRHNKKKFSAILPNTPLQPLSDDERILYLEILKDCNEKNPYSAICGGSLEDYINIRNRSTLVNADTELKRWVQLIKALTPINSLKEINALIESHPELKNNSTPYNYVINPLSREKDLFLCNKTTTKRSRNTNSKVEKISRMSTCRKTSNSKSGCFGEVAQQKVEMAGQGSKFSCISAIKNQKRTIKFGPDELISDNSINEIAVFAALISKENVAQATHAKCTETNSYIIMENYGKNLDELFTYDMPNIVRNTNQEPKALEPHALELFLKALMYQIITGLVNIHAESIIHMDLKPANILLSYDGRLLISDFGSSLRVVKGFDRLQTSIYKYQSFKEISSPEAVLDFNISSKFDIWSLGCCLVYFLTLNYPLPNEIRDKESASDGFAAARIDNTVYKPKIAEIQQKLKDKFSKELLLFMNKLLRLDPSERPAAKDLLSDEWLKGINRETAINTVQATLWSGKHGLISAKKAVNDYISKNYTRENMSRRRIIKYKQQNQNVKKTVKQYLYFLLKTSPDWQISTLDRNTKIRVVNYLFDKITIQSSPTVPGSTLRIDTCLHAIELLDRYVHKKRYITLGDELPVILYVLVRLALYTSPFSTNFKMKEIYNIKKYIKMESDILKTLSGDIFPKKNGLTDIVLNKLEITPKSICAFLALYSLRTTESIETLIEAAKIPLTIDISSFPKIASTLAKEDFMMLQNNIGKLPKA